MKHERLVPMIVAVALFMDNMDSTVIATSLPAIAVDIGTSPLTLKLAVTSYLLSLAVFIPMSGWTADRFGARTVFRAAIAVFVLGSIGCAASHSIAQFVMARIVQGMGGAMMTPVGRLILVRTIDRRELVNAMAWVSIPAMIGPLMGPPLGGFITTFASWHWIFFINVPIGLIGIVLVTRYIENIKAEVPERFDFPGMVLSGTAVAGLTFGLSVAGFEIVPWPIVLLILGVGLAALGLYIAYARRAPAPVLDFSLLKLPTFRASLVGGFMFRIGVGAMPFLLPLLLQVGFHLTPFKSGLITFTSTMGALFMKAAAPRMLKMFGFRNVLVSNAILGGASIALCAIFRESTPFWVMIAILMLGGFFRSLQFTSVNALAYAEVPMTSMSRATALSAVGQQVALATGVAVGALTVEMVVRWHGQTDIMASDFPPGFLLVGLIAASSALIFMLMPPNAGAEMANRVPATAGASDQRMGLASAMRLTRTIFALAGLALLAAVVLSRPAEAQIRTGDEQRCTGAAGVTADAQVAACTALIDSRKFSKQNLAILHSNRGVAYGKAGDYDRAIVDFNEALKINPVHVRAFINRGNALFAKHNYDAAIADFNQAIRLEPKNVQNLISRATAYEAKDDLKSAIADYDAALKLDPTSTAALNSRGIALRRSGSLDRAIADFDQAIKLNGKDVAAYNNRALAYADRRDFDHAAADYEQALKIDPSSALTYLNRGQLWQTRKNYDRALADLNQAVKLGPNNAAAVNARGLTFGAQGEFDKALVDFDSAIRLEPSNANYFDNRGNVWRDRGRFDRSVQDYDQAISLSPGFAFAYYNRAQAHYLAGRFNEALADAGQAAAYNQNSAQALSLRGLILEKLGDRSAAIADLKRAAALDPGWSQATDALARLAADLPGKPAPPSRPASSAPPNPASPLAAPSAGCLEWSDGCRTCQRAASGEIACSNVGIACVPKEAQCTRR